MTTEPVAGPGGDRQEPGTERDGADGARAAGVGRGPVAMVVLFALLALGAGVLVKANRDRSGRSVGKTGRPERSAKSAPHSVIRIAAAPRSVVYVISAPSLGRSHVEAQGVPRA